MSDARVMGLDVGDKRIGVALSDPGQILATGLMTLHRTRLAADLDALVELVEAHAVTRIVVGWPLLMSGRPGGQAFKVQRFVEALTPRVAVPIERFDERLSTAAAQRALIEGDVRRAQRRDLVDKVAATLILQGWLDARTPRIE